MSNYILFGGERFYAKGGIHDLLSYHKTLEEAEKAGIGFLASDRADKDGWFHVLEYKNGLLYIALKSDEQAYGWEERREYE
jgi:hypothetical protein